MYALNCPLRNSSVSQITQEPRDCILNTMAGMATANEGNELPPCKDVDPAAAKKIEANGIRILNAGEGDIERAWELYRSEYMHDEPMNRNSFVTDDDNSWIGQFYNMGFMDYARERLEKNIRAGTTVLAVDADGNAAGFVMGHWKTADYKPKFEDRFFGFLFYLVANFLFFLVSRPVLRTCTVVNRFFTFSKGDNSFRSVSELVDPKCKKVFSVDDICVARRGRGMRLGSAMLSYSTQIARRENCDYMWAILTGIYSQKIFIEEHSWTVVTEAMYADIKDKYGNACIKPCEHISYRGGYKKL